MKEREMANVHMRQANAAFSEGRHHDAIPLYKAALAVQPDRLAAHMNLGVTYHSLRELGSALDSYRTVSLLHPAHDSIYLNMGDAYRAMDRPHEAVEAYTWATTVAPSQQASDPFVAGDPYSSLWRALSPIVSCDS